LKQYLGGKAETQTSGQQTGFGSRPKPDQPWTAVATSLIWLIRSGH